MKKIIIINGPNLNLIGQREPDVYGSENMEDYVQTLRTSFPDVEIDYYQSNIEGELVNKLQEVGFSYDAIIINAGGYTHTSVAIRDAIKAITTPAVEVHISNIMQREDFRHVSLLSGVCVGTIWGFGLDSYRLAMLSFPFIK